MEKVLERTGRVYEMSCKEWNGNDYGIDEIKDALHYCNLAVYYEDLNLYILDPTDTCMGFAGWIVAEWAGTRDCRIRCNVTGELSYDAAILACKSELTGNFKDYYKKIAEKYLDE